MTKDAALKLGLQLVATAEYLATDAEICGKDAKEERALIQRSKIAFEEALAQPEQEPVAWNVVDPTGKIVATEMNSVRGWARIEGYKPTVEGLLGFHEQGWRVVPTTPPQRKPLTDEQLIAAYDSEQQGRYGDHIRSLRAIEAAHGIKGE